MSNHEAEIPQSQEIQDKDKAAEQLDPAEVADDELEEVAGGLVSNIKTPGVY